MSTAKSSVKQTWDSHEGSLSFIQNVGQMDTNVQYYTHGWGRRFYFTSHEAILTFVEEPSGGRSDTVAHRQGTKYARTKSFAHKEQTTRGIALVLSFLSASPNVSLEGQDECCSRVNYFIGRNPAKWYTNIRSYRNISYKNLWSGVNLTFREENRRLKYHFVVQPNANIQDIQLTYRGAEDFYLVAPEKVPV